MRNSFGSWTLTSADVFIKTETKLFSVIVWILLENNFYCKQFLKCENQKCEKVYWSTSIAHLFQDILVIGIDVFIAESPNRCFVRFFVGEKIASVACFLCSPCDHFSSCRLSVVCPTKICEEVDDSSCYVVLITFPPSKLSGSVVKRENVLKGTTKIIKLRQPLR